MGMYYNVFLHKKSGSAIKEDPLYVDADDGSCSRPLLLTRDPPSEIIISQRYDNLKNYD